MTVFYVLFLSLSLVHLMLQTPETVHRIHFQDCDPLGHLNNARYLDYFLNAREEHVLTHYAAQLSPITEAQQAAWVITKHHISYLKPARPGQQVRILSQLIHFENANLVIEMQMRDEAGTRLLALLWSEMAYVRVLASIRLDHSNALMDLLDALDVDSIDYDPDGFDERVQRIRQELKKQRRSSE